MSGLPRSPPGLVPHYGLRPVVVAAGAAVAALVAAAALPAWQDGSPLAPPAGGLRDGAAAWPFLGLLVAAFLAYLLGLAGLRRTEGGAGIRTAAAIAVLVQAVPLAAPLLLSTDAWTYWSYGWIGQHDGNPYVDLPLRFPESPALAWMGADWRDVTSVYGPAFTLASEPIAAAAGGSADAAAWLFKGLAAAGAIAGAVLAGRIARRRSLAVAFVGWNPLLAIHLGGGGHNDAWVAALVAAALLLARTRRLDAAGVLWALAILVKWVPLVFFALRAIEARASGRPVRHAGFAAAATAVLAVATWRYGVDWARALAPLAANAERQTSYALPARLESAGVPEAAALTLAAAVLVVGLVLLARSAARGRVRLGLCACLLLLTTPYLAAWYLAWPVTLAAADDGDPAARVLALALSAYLLPQAIPL